MQLKFWFLMEPGYLLQTYPLLFNNPKRTNIFRKLFTLGGDVYDARKYFAGQCGGPISRVRIK